MIRCPWIRKTDATWPLCRSTIRRSSRLKRRSLLMHLVAQDVASAFEQGMGLELAWHVIKASPEPTTVFVYVFRHSWLTHLSISRTRFAREMTGLITELVARSILQ
jgi:hypothetical protein